MTEPKTMHFDGPCPFLTCLEEGPHDHPICPDCGTVRYGNMYCPTCRSHYYEHVEEYKRLVEALAAMEENHGQALSD